MQNVKVKSYKLKVENVRFLIANSKALKTESEQGNTNSWKLKANT